MIISNSREETANNFKRLIDFFFLTTQQHRF